MTNSIRPAVSDAVLAMSFIAAVVVLSATYQTAQYWIGHAILGSASLGLILEIDIMGAMAARRIRKPSDFSPFLAHKKASGQFLALSIGSFLVGVLIRFHHGDPPMATAHGWIGLAVCLIAVPQWLSCRYKVRSSVRRLHQVLGYGLLAILMIQTFLGAWMAYLPGSLG